MKKKRINRTSKYKRLYGMTLTEMAKDQGVSVYKVYTNHIEEQKRYCSNCKVLLDGIKTVSK